MPKIDFKGVLRHTHDTCQYINCTNDTKHHLRQCQTVFLHALKVFGHLLSHHVLYIVWRFRCVKKLIATLLGHLPCHPIGRANCVLGKIKRSGWSVATSFISLQFFCKQVNVGNPFSRRVWHLVDIQNCL